MQGGILCLVQANHGFETIDVPVSHGSTRMVYTPGADRKSELEGCASGEKVSRKLLSAFKCLTVSDMADDRRGESGGAAPEGEGQTLRPSPIHRFFCSDVGGDAELLAGWAQKVDMLCNGDGEAKRKTWLSRAGRWVWCVRRPCRHKCVISPNSRARHDSARAYSCRSNLQFRWGCATLCVPETGMANPFLSSTKTHPSTVHRRPCGACNT